jgi:hypothetical protein
VSIWNPLVLYEAVGAALPQEATISAMKRMEKTV